MSKWSVVTSQEALWMGRDTRRLSQWSGLCQAIRVQAVRESRVVGRRIIRRLPVCLQSSVQCSSAGCLERAIAHTTSREYVAECAMSHSNKLWRIELRSSREVFKLLTWTITQTTIHSYNSQSTKMWNRRTLSASNHHYNTHHKMWNRSNINLLLKQLSTTHNLISHKRKTTQFSW